MKSKCGKDYYQNYDLMMYNGVVNRRSSNYFGSFPREALVILQHMLASWPNTKMFSVDVLSQVTGMSGRALSGSLSSFSKRSGRPLIVKAGTIDKTSEGKKFKRPKQLWALNPALIGSNIQEMREKINQLVGLDDRKRVSSGWEGLEFALMDSDSTGKCSSTSARLGESINVN